MSNQTPFALYWTGDAEAPASSVASASCYRGLENVGILSVVKTPRELVQVERQILLAHIVIRPDDAPLQEAPEVFDVIRVNAAAHVFALAMMDGFVRVEMLQIRVANILVSRDQGDFVLDGLFHEKAQGVGIGFFDRLTDHVTLARNRADDGHLARIGRSTAAVFGADVLVAVLLLAAKEGFINLNFARQFGVIIAEHRANAVAHIKSGLVCSRLAVLLQHPLNLERAHSFLALANQIDDLEPERQRIVGILEHGTDERRESIAVLLVADRDKAGILVDAFLAALAYPRPIALGDPEDLIVAATNAAHAVRPAHFNEQGHASILGVILFVNLSEADHEQTLHLFRAWCQVRNNRQTLHPYAASQKLRSPHMIGAIVVRYSLNIVDAIGGDPPVIRRAVREAVERDRKWLLQQLEHAMDRKARTEFD